MALKRRVARLRNLEQVRQFLNGELTIDVRIRTRTDAYEFIAETLLRFDYFYLGKADKGVLQRYLAEVAGLSRAQLFRLLNQYRTTGQIADRRGVPRRPFPRRYTDADIELLAEVDALHGALSGPVARALCARAYHLFGDRRFQRLARISNGHVYNLRRSRTYRRHRSTKPTAERPLIRALDERRRPQPVGLPGKLRVSLLDVDAGGGGVYYLGFVDEATQFRFVNSIERVDTVSVGSVLDSLLRAIPFTLRRFQADNGSETVSRDVAAILQSLHGDRFGRFRAHSGNPPVEIRNASVTERVNVFTRQLLSPYLNYHRPCMFPTDPLEPRGCGGASPSGNAEIVTPYERLKSLPGADACLTSGTTFAQLDAAASAVSDDQAARLLTDGCERLFRFLEDGT